MNEPANDSAPELTGFDKANLYRRETYADPNAGEIICLVPITIGNMRDVERKMRFFSSIMANVRGQPTALPFELPADTLEGAIDAWPEGAKKAGEEFQARLAEQQLTRSLVMPSGARMPPSKPN